MISVYVFDRVLRLIELGTGYRGRQGGTEGEVGHQRADDVRGARGEAREFVFYFGLFN
jgi:hypothetical protein